MADNPKFDPPPNHVPDPGPVQCESGRPDKYEAIVDRSTPDSTVDAGGTYVPAPGPASSPNPSDYEPPAGPVSTANPNGYIPAPGPESSPNPSGYAPAPGPESTPNPLGHVPAGPPESSGVKMPQPSFQPDDTNAKARAVKNPTIKDKGPYVPRGIDLNANDLQAPTRTLLRSSGEQYAPGGSLDPRKDINFQRNLLDSNIATAIDSVFGDLGSVTAGGVASIIKDPKELSNVAKRLGNSLKIKGENVLAGLFIRGEETLREAVDLGLIGNNRWHSLNKAEDVISKGDAPRRSVTEWLTTKEFHGNSLSAIRKDIIKYTLGQNYSVGRNGSPNPDLDGDGFVSGKEVEEFSKNGALDSYLEEVNGYSPNHKYEEEPRFNLKQFNGITPHLTNELVNEYEENRQSNTFKPSLTKLFGPKPIAKLGEGRAQRIPNRSRENVPKDPLKASSFSDGIIPMKMPKEDETGLVVTSFGQNPADKISDDEAYVPLSFTDIRPMGESSAFQQTIYFRPIITSLTEDFSPEWNKRTMFGRSDQVVTYASTVRTIFLGFELHAFSREDVDVIYKKLHWLSSLAYPQYDREFLLKAGPVCRMRVGDVIASRDRLGIPGIIDSLSYDYTDSLWELDPGSKAPRSIKVSVSFHALHDSVVGKDVKGNFGGIGLPGGVSKQFEPEYVTSPDAFRRIGSVFAKKKEE